MQGVAIDLPRNCEDCGSLASPRRPIEEQVRQLIFCHKALDCRQAPIYRFVIPLARSSSWLEQCICESYSASRTSTMMKDLNRLADQCMLQALLQGLSVMCYMPLACVVSYRCVVQSKHWGSLPPDQCINQKAGHVPSMLFRARDTTRPASS